MDIAFHYHWFCNSWFANILEYREEPQNLDVHIMFLLEMLHMLLIFQGGACTIKCVLNAHFGYSRWAQLLKDPESSFAKGKAKRLMHAKAAPAIYLSHLFQLVHMMSKENKHIKKNPGCFVLGRLTFDISWHRGDKTSEVGFPWSLYCEECSSRFQT